MTHCLSWQRFCFFWKILKKKKKNLTMRKGELFNLSSTWWALTQLLHLYAIHLCAGHCAGAETWTQVRDITAPALAMVLGGKKTGIQATPVLETRTLFLGHLEGLFIWSVSSTLFQEPCWQCWNSAGMCYSYHSYPTIKILLNQLTNCCCPDRAHCPHYHLENAALIELTPDTRQCSGITLAF